MLLPSSSGCSAYAASTSRVEVGDQLLALLGQAHRLAAHQDHVLDRRRPGDVRVGHDRGDLAERVVLVLGQAGVRRQDEVRLRGRDRLEGDAVGLVEEHRGLGAQLLELLLDPGQDAVIVVVAPARRAHADRHDAQGQRHLVVGPGDRGDPLGLGLDRGLAEGVLDGDGEGVGGRGGGRWCRRRPRSRRRRRRRRRGSASDRDRAVNRDSSMRRRFRAPLRRSKVSLTYKHRLLDGLVALHLG